MIKTNHFLIKGGKLTEAQSRNIVSRLMSAKSTPEQAGRFYRRVKYPDNTGADGRRMYPLFFIPPFDEGRKPKTVLNQTPKTHLFSANMYELEILRLLFLLEPKDPEIKDMTLKTLLRLNTTCFGSADDGTGECFDTSLVVLRFLAAAVPDDKERIRSRTDNYNRHFPDKKRPSFCRWYYRLCLSELPFDTAKPEIEKDKPEMLNLLTKKSYVMNSDGDKTMHPVLLCILRNALAKYPEYSYIKDRQPYVKTPGNGKAGEKDGRLYFDFSRES